MRQAAPAEQFSDKYEQGPRWEKLNFSNRIWLQIQLLEKQGTGIPGGSLAHQSGGFRWEER